MSLKQYKNSADILSGKSSIEGFRYKPEDFSLLITRKERAFEDPADQTIDYAVEMHVYTPDGDWLAGDHRLESVKIPSIAARRRFLQLDLRSELEEIGIERGSYKLVFNFIKNLLGNTENRSIFIKEISPNRKEVWLTLADSLSTEIVPDDDITLTLEKQFKEFTFYANKKYNKGCANVALNLGNNNIFKVVNVRIGGLTTNEELGETNLGSGQNIYLKLYDELPTDIVEKQRAWIVQEDKRPVIESVNVYPEVEPDTFSPIKGPNFDIDQDYAMKTETDFKSWNDLLDTTTGTTQQIIDRYFSGSLAGVNLNVDYSKFDNFVKYSSAEERLKNFRYKLELIEYYDTQLAILASASGSDSGSLKGNEAINTKRKNEVIGGFDAFERWAYNEPTASLFTHGVSGSTLYAEDYCIKPYPKFLENGDFVRHHTTSSLGQSWFNGLISSGSLYDLENEDSLINSIPENILRDENNDQYILFVNMIGHHYDILYSYIRELTNFHRQEEHPKLGIPNELLYDIAKSMGWTLSNGNQAEALWTYKLGKTVSGSFQSSGSLASKSSEDITTEIWRRIVNNLPYILKTKGTKRSVHALMNTYGIPRTLLSIREYGGPKAPEQEPDLIEDRFSYALQFNPGAQIAIPNSWHSSSMGSDWGIERGLIPIRTHQFRFKPGETSSMILMSNTNNTGAKVKWHIAVQHTGSYSGSSKYGRLHFAIGKDNQASSSFTDYVPIYDGNFWNVMISTNHPVTASVAAATQPVTYTLRTQHASDYITGKIVHSASLSLTPSTDSSVNWSNSDEKRRLYLGGNTGSDNASVNAALSASFNVPPESGSSFVVTNETGNPGTFPGVFSGSMQEYRGWLEEIDKATFDIHTLNPTSYVGTISPTSSFHTLIRHYTLGSDTKAIDHSTGAGLIISSSHPNQKILDFSPGSGSNNSGSNSYASASGFTTPTNAQRGNYQILTETYYVDAPSIGGTNTNSEKIRIEDQKLVSGLDPMSMAERSRYDYATLDSNRLGLFYSSADQVNKDIYNQIGAIALDDFFGDPADEFNVVYPELNKIAQEYWKKYTTRNDINAYIKIFSLFDFSLFNQIKQLIPARVDAAMGLLIEPHVLERAKVQIISQPSITNPNFEQRISLATSTVTGSRLDYKALLHDPRSVTASTQPLEATMSITRTITSSVFEPINTGSLQKSDIKFAGPDISSSTEAISHKGGNNSLEIVNFALVGGTTFSSSIVPSNYKLESFHHKQTVNGIVYSGSNRSMEGPVVVTDYALGTAPGSNLTEVDYDRGVTASAAIQAVILEQRKSYIYKKKVEFFAPKSLATRHYAFDQFDGTSTSFLDLTTNYQHSIAYRQKQAGDSSNETNATAAAARFETVTHNFFTGSALIFTPGASQATLERGCQFIRIPRVTFTTGTKNNSFGSKFSLSALLTPASQSGKGDIAWAGESGTTNPGFWIADDGTLVLRDTTGTYYGNLGGNTEQPGTSLNFPVQQGQESTYHVVYTFDGTSGSLGHARFYVNGKFQHEVKREGHTTGSGGQFYLEEIGCGYNSANNTYGYTGSIAQVQVFDNHVLSDEEIKYLNKFPHLRPNRDKAGNEIFTRQYGGVAARSKQHWVPGKGIKEKNTLFAPYPVIGLPTSHSLEPADYRDDDFTGITRKHYEGSKLTGPDFNINTTTTTDGGPVVSFTITNPNTLTSKEGNLKVQ